jgi:hypothetical protein
MICQGRGVTPQSKIDSPSSLDSMRVALMGAPCMKTKDITEWCERWSPLSGLWMQMHPWRTVCWSICLYGERRSSVSRYNAKTQHISARSEHRVICTIRLFRCLVPLHLPQATLQISVFRPVPITTRQLFSDIMRSIHFTWCEDQLPKTRFL